MSRVIDPSLASHITATSKKHNERSGSAGGVVVVVVRVATGEVCGGTGGKVSGLTDRRNVHFHKHTRTRTSCGTYRDYVLNLKLPSVRPHVEPEDFILCHKVQIGKV